MPIRAENRARYPKNWGTIRAEILDRAHYACEGSPAYPDCRAINHQPHPATGSGVVLTIAHLDHQPENNAPDNLRAWCQRCHNTYDAPMRAAGVKARRNSGRLCLGGLMPDRPDHEGDEAGRCGGCGSRNMLVSSDGEHAVCLDCHRMQEPETRDWPESRMCNNCAFRVGSPERADPWRWMQIEETLETGNHFHCHKGLAMTLDPDLAKATFAMPDARTGRVTVCAGWLAAYIAKLKREEKAR